MQDQSGRPRVRRDTAWKRDGRARGIYWRRRANGRKSWGYFADGKIHSAPSRQAAIDSKAQAGLRRSAGLPAPDTRVKIADLAEEVARRSGGSCGRRAYRRSSTRSTRSCSQR
jgi:hypothetical protein